MLALPALATAWFVCQPICLQLCDVAIGYSVDGSWSICRSLSDLGRSFSMVRCAV